MTVVCLASAKVYERCELARELRNVHRMPEHQIATWVCIAKHESLYNTSAHNPGSGDHGLFQISQIYWCSPPGQGYGCFKPCSAFADDDIADDVKCIRTIFEEHSRISGDGFNAWVVYPLYCKGDVSQYVQGCYDNIYEVPPVPTVKPQIDEDYDDGYEFPPLPVLPKNITYQEDHQYQYPELPRITSTFRPFDYSAYRQPETTTTIRNVYNSVEEYDDYSFPSLPPFPKHESELNQDVGRQDDFTSPPVSFIRTEETTYKPETTPPTTTINPRTNFDTFVKYSQGSYENTKDIYRTTSPQLTTKLPQTNPYDFSNIYKTTAEKFVPTTYSTTTIPKLQQHNPYDFSSLFSTKKLEESTEHSPKTTLKDFGTERTVTSVVPKRIYDFATVKPGAVKVNANPYDFSTLFAKASTKPAQEVTLKPYSVTTDLPTTTKSSNIYKSNPYDFSKLLNNQNPSSSTASVQLSTTRRPIIYKNNPYDFSNLFAKSQPSTTTTQKAVVGVFGSRIKQPPTTTTFTHLSFKPISTTKSPYNFADLFTTTSKPSSQSFLQSSSSISTVVTSNSTTPKDFREARQLGFIKFKTETKDYTFRRIGNGFRLIRKDGH